MTIQSLNSRIFYDTFVAATTYFERHIDAINDLNVFPVPDGDTGTNMYRDAIRSFLRGMGVDDSIGIKSLKWRAGEWPGYLEIILENGEVMKAEKFYYNYLTLLYFLFPT